MTRNNHEIPANIPGGLSVLRKLWAIVTFGSARPQHDLESAEKTIETLIEVGADPRDIENALHSAYLQAEEWESEE